MMLGNLKHPERTIECDVIAHHRADGSILLRHAAALPPLDAPIPAIFARWARKAPDRVFLSEGSGAAARRITYGEAQVRRRSIAARLLALPLGFEKPLLVLGENGIMHAMVVLAATSVGIPVAVVSPSYVAPAAAPWARFARIVSQLGPGVILTDKSADLAAALPAGTVCDIQSLTDFGWLDTLPPVAEDALAKAERNVTADTVAKLLFTSGSTGSPKAVINTHRMMVSNMQGLSIVWPFLAKRPPVLVDWLPWSHTFGGNCCFNIALYFGGTLHIDAGKPAPKLIDRTVAAIRQHAPTLYFNVPVGYEKLLPFLENDTRFASSFLGNLDFLFNAGAPLPAGIRARLERASEAAIGRIVPILGGWGATETAPFSTVLPRPSEHAGSLGIPLPGTTIKMVPCDGRMELRVQGPNVMPGYWREPEATRAAFDEEGFYCIGDAGRLAVPHAPGNGILFDGRITENFKLTSGTWVNVGALRLAILQALEGFAADAVIAGEGRDEIGLLLFPNADACRALPQSDTPGADDPAGVGAHPAVIGRFASLLRTHNGLQMGSSTRIARFMILAEPPSAADGEVTDKGYLNQRAVLARRRQDVARLYVAGEVL